MCVCVCVCVYVCVVGCATFFLPVEITFSSSSYVIWWDQTLKSWSQHAASWITGGPACVNHPICGKTDTGSLTLNKPSIFSKLPVDKRTNRSQYLSLSMSPPEVELPQLSSLLICLPSTFLSVLSISGICCCQISLIFWSRGQKLMEWF